MKLLGFLAIFLSTFAVMDAVAPNDFSVTCRTDFQYRAAHDWIPYANDTSSGTWKVLIDQYDYQSILGADPRTVWKAIDADTQPTPDGITVRLDYKLNRSLVNIFFHFSLPKAVVEHAPIKLE